MVTISNDHLTVEIAETASSWFCTRHGLHRCSTECGEGDTGTLRF